MSKGLAEVAAASEPDVAGSSEVDAKMSDAPVEQEEWQGPRFRLMDLPTELRLHIYRCALVRPYEVLLHKDQPPPPPPPQRDDDSDDEDNDDAIAYRRARAQGMRREFTTRLRTRSQTARARADFEMHRRMRQGLHRRRTPTAPAAPVKKSRPQDAEPLNAALLRVSQTVYKEARQVLYSENTFYVEFDSGVQTMQALHQRSRSMIRHIKLTIPNAGDILDQFADLVRLAIRYCWHLQRFEIVLPFRLTSEQSDARNSAASRATIHMYANSFNILRWLPRQTKVTVAGEVCEEIRRVIDQNETLAKILDDQAYARRQHQISDKSVQPVPSILPPSVTR